MYQYTRKGILGGLEVQRFQASQAARPQFSGMTPAQRASELIARLEIAKAHRDRPAFDAAQAELKTLIEQL